MEGLTKIIKAWTNKGSRDKLIRGSDFRIKKRWDFSVFPSYDIQERCSDGTWYNVCRTYQDNRKLALLLKKCCIENLDKTLKTS